MKTTKMGLIRQAQKDPADEDTAWRDRLEQWLELQEKETIRIQWPLRKTYQTDWGELRGAFSGSSRLDKFSGYITDLTEWTP